MKRTAFLIFSVLVSTLVFSQPVTKNTLLGSWKPVRLILGNNEIKLNLENDSLDIDESITKNWSSDDSLMMIFSISLMKVVYQGKELTFSENGVVSEKSSDKVKDGTYIWDQSTAGLTMKITSEEKYTVSMDKDLLVLLNPNPDDGAMRIILRKIK